MEATASLTEQHYSNYCLCPTLNRLTGQTFGFQTSIFITRVHHRVELFLLDSRPYKPMNLIGLFFSIGGLDKASYLTAMDCSLRYTFIRYRTRGLSPPPLPIGSSSSLLVILLPTANVVL